MERLQIRADEAGARLDKVLCDRLSLSRAQAKRLFEGKEVRRNGRRAGKGELVVEGDTIELRAEPATAEAWPDPSVELHILHEDPHFVVLDKQAGIPCHPIRPGEVGCIANGLLARYPEMAQVGYDVRQPGLVNRLDNDTTGILLAARSQEAFTALRSLLETGKVEKTYLALTALALTPQIIELPISPSAKHRSRVEVNPLGRIARTEVQSCRPRGEFFLVEARAERAYRHQVRVHLAAVGAAIVGDALYGGVPGERHYLHAARARFKHPVTGEELSLEASLPGDWPGA